MRKLIFIRTDIPTRMQFHLHPIRILRSSFRTRLQCRRHAPTRRIHLYPHGRRRCTYVYENGKRTQPEVLTNLTLSGRLGVAVAVGFENRDSKMAAIETRESASEMQIAQIPRKKVE